MTSKNRAARTKRSAIKVRHPTKFGRSIVLFGNTWRDVRPPSQRSISSAETELGFPLPDNLKMVLLSIARGQPENNYILTNGNEFGVGMILPAIRSGRVPGIRETVKAMRVAQDLPSSMIPFATDTGHANYYVLDVSTGTVNYWLHDDPEDRSRFAADTIEIFLASLVPCPF